MLLDRLHGAEAYRAVLAFLVRQWRTRLPLVAGVVAAIVGATLGDVFLPLFAGRLVDALSAADRMAARGDALLAFAAMAGLGLITLGLRHVAWALVVPLTLSTM
jgi:ATP-binding cassette subfamily B protein